ncbi:hypothetical protein [Ruminococcus bicirculans (ex Wegman et al. 2014)]|uniref:hypothetical protein n=1 Tax=Ruminococcus bicirculans (ex Wegman et al. 2014) TaxID=1160721 RepID=UPI00241CE9A0|nr:hypothetical protein [Ruminococcus bicirculans (ex Wegman et al. 2014)]MBS6408371.1 hypothetical protein [Ruminococcus bicirculans (ex Wegman et al. 2014)]
MKANRNQKINRICHKLYSKYRKNVISLVTAVVLLVTSMPLADISGVVSKMVSTVTNAITAMAADTYTDITNDIKNGVYTIQNADDFKKLLNADPYVYQNITVLFSNNQSQFKASDFTGIEKGLGNENYPFMGTVKANEGSAINLPINFALFEYLSDSANLDTIIFARPEEKNSSLLAENVVHGDVASANKWKIKADPVDDSGATIYKSFTSVIGNMKKGATVDLDITLSNGVKVEVSGGDNAGLACGSMDENTSLAVSLSSSSLDVSGKSNAGVFIGKMSADATLSIDKCDTLTSVNISANNAGGLVGSAENAEINVGEGVTLTMTGSVTGSVTVGGLFGSYTYSKANEKTFDISKFSGMKMALACSSGDTADSAAVGSVFGLLTNSADIAKISITGTANDIITSNFDGTVRAGFYGGIVGRYSANALSSELALSDIIVNVTGSCNALDFGGIIGKIGDNSKAYVSVKNTTIRINNPTSSQNNYGGLVGYADQAFIDVGGKVTVTANNVSANQSVGGIVGKFNKNGVVRLGGETNLSGFYPKDPNKNGCQIVGNRGNALIYSLSGWSFTRTSSKVIDDMDWGGVLRLNNSDLLESAGGVLSFDGSGHTVTINGFSNNNITISNRADFARAALIMQHESNDFVKYSGASRADMLAANISLSADVAISDTGLTGFMRDNGEDTFTGTLNGNSHTITMSVGKDAKIVFHTHNGLFAKTSGAKISNLMLVSNFNIVGDNVSGGDACYIGSISAYNSGALTIDSVTANVTASPSGAYTNFVGGLVGYVADATSEVSFTNSAVTANLTYNNSTTKVDCTCLGGVIGMVGAVTSTSAPVIKFDNVTVGGKITDKHTGSNSRVGGLIAEVGAKDNSASVVPNKISITNVNINALTINSSGKSNSGGFLGHNWYRVEIDLNSLNVNNSRLTVNNGTELGGLVLSTTGYWSIKDVSFDGVTVKATKCINFGMLASTLFGRDYDSYGFDYFKGENVNNYRSSRDATYFELTKPNGYKISQDTKINISPSYSYFDEIARCSIYASNSPVCNRQAIISIPAVTADGERLLYMDGKNCNTYQNQTTNNGAVWKNNSWARYYYNLDVYKNGKATTGGAKAVEWSAKLFAANNIKAYINSTNIDFPTDPEIDLTGYSFYPVDTNGCNIKSNSTITFENNGFNQSEMVSSSNSDNYARTTDGIDGTNLTNDHNQHYMMQCGLFRNENGAVTISGKMTFKGNIGKVNGGSGALVCGSVADDTNTTKKSVKITGSIVLDDLYVNDTSLSLNGENSYAPLLINKIGNMTEITIQNVSQKKHSRTTAKYDKGGQDYAATSLIGNVGSEKGQNISLTFSNIKLDASDVNSIFKNATLLESFQHSDGAGSSAIYNYKWDDDWGTDSAGNIKHNVTYGKEVSDTIKNRVDNVSRQNKYHGDWSKDDRYTSPVKNNATEEYSFTEYKPYVAKSAVTGQTDSTYDEIDVNLERPYLDEGCGTYSDPYILDASTLAEVARVISTTAPTNGWQVNYNANVSADKSTVNANSAFCKGTNHKTYTYDGTGNFVSGNETVSKDNMIKYLCEAYYKINDDIVLGSSFAGLGGTSNSYVFRGVIVGQKRSDGTYPTITNNSASPLIRFSSGSVVKDINIEYTKEVTLSKNNNNKLNYSTGKTEYYGGVMGVVFGGDNIIDNVKVTNPNIKFANNDNSKQHLITAGGYVGAIVYGGVIFRNMDIVAKDSALTISNTVAVGEDVYTNLFINPYIGRVVNGFAIEEGTTFGKSTNLNNGRKNYLITQFKSELSDEEKLNVIAGTTNTIEVPNAQALFMLSIISQSGMGYTDRKNNTCGYGHYTFTRNADYSKVGTATLTSDDKDYKTALSDYQRLERATATSREYEKKNSVMLKKYTKPSEKGLYEAKWAHELNKNFTVKLTGNGTYDLTGTGFRGINQLFDATNSNLGDIKCDYTLSLTAIQGNDQTIKLDTDIKAYAVKITDNKSGNTIEFQDVDNYKYRTAFASVKGVGLINCSTYALIVNDLKLSGKISVKTYNNDGQSYVNEDLSTGGIVGGVQSSCTFSGITLTDLEIYGAYTVGGLIGKSTNTINISNVKSENSGVYVYGGFETGGLVGNSQKGNEFAVKDSKIKINKVEFANLDKGTKTWFGVGGIAGSANIKTTISNVQLTAYNEDSFIGSNKDNKPLATQTMNEGGLIGLSNGACTITKTSVSVDVYGSNAGGFVGINKNQLSINDCYYGGTSETSACGVYGYTSSGGMVGTQNAAVTISKSAVKNATIGIPAAKNGDAGIGGYVGIKANGDLKISDCEVNNVTLSAEDKSNGAGAGGVIGHNDRGNTYAYDILINKLGYVRGNNSVSVSNLIGWNNDKNLPSKFIGVSVNNTDCLPDIQYNNSEAPTNFIAVHSDYNGTQDNTKNIGEGSGTHVDIYSPYVNINPSVPVGGKTFAGDLVGGNMQTIISDAASYTNGTAKKSYGINSTIKTYAENLDKSKLTTFRQASELDVQELNDLPVLLIDDNSSLNITQMLAKYISVLTNCDVCDSSSNKLKTTDLMNVSTATYVYDNDVLKKSDKSTLTFNSKTGYFKVTDGQYDNDGTNRFTVITLDYIDPTGSGKTALRLHVPVFVRKVLDFSFQSYVISGTDYNHSHYTDKTKLAFESFDAPVTTYFKYSYYKSANEWEKMLNNGDSLLWSFDKKLYLIGDSATDSGVLTDDTKLTLVDANNNDKTYHSTASDAKFNKTTGELDLTNISGFKPVTMNDVLLRYASVTAKESSDGTLVEADDEATATVKTSDGKYYRPAGENETVTYKITVSANSNTPKNDNDEMIISENYYLTINIPETGSSKKVIKNFVNYYSGNKPRKLNGNIPTNLVQVTNNDTGAYVIANFFTQLVSVTAHDPEEITASNNFVRATMTSKISIDPSLRDTFNGYKSDDFNMYQAFKFSMKNFDEKDAGANAKIIAGTSVNVDYSILNSSDTELSNAKISKTETLSEAKDSYMLMYPNSVYDYINSDTNGSITVKADISLTYGTAGIIDQFPERKDGDAKTGIGVNAASYVAYSQNNIENSSISASGVMPAIRYYRKAMTVAQLNYNVAESTVLESKDSPFSQLGINAKDMTTGEMAITANAIYDLSALSRSTKDSGKKIQYTMRLYVKDNSGDYKQTNDISKYLSSFTLENATSSSGLNGKECVFTTDYNGEEQNTAVTKFTVKTGKAFEEQGLTYANYRVELTAVLLNDNNLVVNGTTSSDYVVYTNAKIETGFINS